jgi:glucose/arabinose dehydrogenase
LTAGAAPLNILGSGQGTMAAPARPKERKTMRSPVLAAATAALLVLSAGDARAQTGLNTAQVASGFSLPLYVVSPPGDTNRLFVVEQRGKIRIIKNGTTLATPFLDVGNQGLGLLGSNGNEQGLLGLAFHPDYANNGRFFINYTNVNDDTVVEEYTVSSNPDIANTSGTLIIGPIFQPQSNHNGGCLQFSPADGMLYIGMGDGGNFNDTGPGHAAGGNAQSPSTLLGKVLRLDVDIPFPHIPGSNPFVSDPNTLDEIWAFGVRNPWRFSFTSSGDMYLGDVGQDAFEEVNFEPAGMGGRNYGWRCMEGFSCTGLSGCTCNAPSLTLPVDDYSHGGGNCSVTGGYMYEGCAMPDFTGTYFFADYCSGRIWSFELVGGVVTNFTNRTTELDPPGVAVINQITSFGVDALGEIYIVDQGGQIYKILPDTIIDCNANLVHDACDIATGSSDDCNLNAVPDECDAFATSYCTPGTSASGCVATLSATGIPSISAGSGFVVDTTGLEGQKDGLFFYGFNGPQANSWGNGTSYQCVVPPVIRTPLMAGIGTIGLCDGDFSLDLNAYWSTAPAPKVPAAGQQVDLQLWYRDPFSTSNQTTSLSDGLEFTVCP